MKHKELKEKDKEELKALLSEQRERLLELRMKSAEARPKNVKEAKEIRKMIARILTILKI